MTAYNNIDMNNLRNHRRERSKDQLVRMTMGLRYIGLQYTAYCGAPKEVYRDENGRDWFKVGPCDYRQA